MQIFVTDHCIEQIIKRKKKETNKSAILFAIGVFTTMMNTLEYKGNKCKKGKANNNKFFISEEVSGYKFIYYYDEENKIYKLITFIVRTKLDREIGSIMKILGMI